MNWLKRPLINFAQFQENDWKLSRQDQTNICPLDIIQISLTLSPESPTQGGAAFADNLELNFSNFVADGIFRLDIFIEQKFC